MKPVNNCEFRSGEAKEKVYSCLEGLERSLIGQILALNHNLI